MSKVMSTYGYHIDLPKDFTRNRAIFNDERNGKYFAECLKIAFKEERVTVTPYPKKKKAIAYIKFDWLAEVAETSAAEAIWQELSFLQDGVHDGGMPRSLTCSTHWSCPYGVPHTQVIERDVRHNHESYHKALHNIIAGYRCMKVQYKHYFGEFPINKHGNRRRKT